MDNDCHVELTAHPACRIACTKAEKEHSNKDHISATLIAEEVERYLVIVFLNHSMSKLIPQPVAHYAVGKNLEWAESVDLAEGTKHGYFLRQRK